MSSCLMKDHIESQTKVSPSTETRVHCLVFSDKASQELKETLFWTKRSILRDWDHTFCSTSKIFDRNIRYYGLLLITTWSPSDKIVQGIPFMIKISEHSRTSAEVYLSSVIGVWSKYRMIFSMRQGSRYVSFSTHFWVPLTLHNLRRKI
jgi:hypothetical protein